MQSQRSLPCYDGYLAESGAASPVLSKVKAKRFVSRSKGWRNGKRRIRKVEKDVTLVKYGDSGFKYWDNGDTNMNGKIPFDQWATEIYGEGYCAAVGRHSDDHLRQEIRDLLDQTGGKF